MAEFWVGVWVWGPVGQGGSGGTLVPEVVLYTSKILFSQYMLVFSVKSECDQFYFFLVDTCLIRSPALSGAMLILFTLFACCPHARAIRHVLLLLLS